MCSGGSGALSPAETRIAQLLRFILCTRWGCASHLWDGTPGLLQGGLKGGDCPALHLEEAVPWEPVSSMEAGATSDLFFAVALMPPVEGLHLWNEPVNAIVMPLFFKCLQQRDAGPYVISSLNGPPQHPIFSVSCWHLFAVLLVYPVMPAMCRALRGM